MLLFTKFKVGKPSPNKNNDCSGVVFILHENLDDILENIDSIDNRSILSTSLTSKLEHTPKACLSSTEIKDYMSLTTASVSKTRNCVIDRAKRKYPFTTSCPNITLQ